MKKILRSLGWTKGLVAGQSGQALIETALTIPFLLLIMVGGLELGRLAYAAIETSNAASAAVQYGAQSSSTAFDCNGTGGGTCTTTSGMYLAAKGDANDLQALTVSVSYALACSDGTAPTYAYGSTNANQDCPGATIETVMSVYTQAKVGTWFRFPGLPTTFTLYGHATQMVLGN